MGQKIHPEGFRVGYIHDWKSNWFEEKNFADVLQEDLQIRDHIVNKLSHAGLSNITIERRGEVAVDIHTARPGIVIGKSGSEVDALRKELHKLDRQPGESEHPRGQAPRARRQAGRPVDRRAAAEPGRLPAGDETRPHLGDALRRQGRQGPGLRPPRRRRDGADRKLFRRSRAAAHAARRHRLRLLRGPHHDRPDRRQMLDQQGRGDARGLPLRPRLDRRRAAAGRATRGGGGRGRGPGGDRAPAGWRPVDAAAAAAAAAAAVATVAVSVGGGR